MNQAFFPRSTYRLQMHAGFTFQDARRRVPYFHVLGIHALYLSPIFEARPQSTYGYDGTNPTRLNPELGSSQDFEELVRTAQDHGMGLIIDIVPNHLATSAQNPFWMDVLKFGTQSRYARFFAIDWTLYPGASQKQVLLPILGKTYAECLEGNELKIRRDQGEYKLFYYDQEFPLSPNSDLNVLEELALSKRSPEALQKSMDKILSQQAYRLAYWKTGREKINYRRFFEINDLIALRIEDPEVFQWAHGLATQLIHSGKIQGLRIDHIDGLYNPKGYLRHLQEALNGSENTNANRSPSTYLIVEKILSEEEALPLDWPIAGSTGYEFGDRINNLLIDRRGTRLLQENFCKRSFGEQPSSPYPIFEKILFEKKKEILMVFFASELERLFAKLCALSEANKEGRDLSFSQLKETLINLSAALPIYRTYIDSEGCKERDQLVLKQAVSALQHLAPSVCQESLHFLFERLTLRSPPAEQWLDWIQRWQQLTSPLMAKGLEDTLMYTFTPLLALNEVGGRPDSRGIEIEEFHHWNQQRQANFPFGLNTTSTHDSKRSEDVRSRLQALSESAEEWIRNARKWHRLNQDKLIALGRKLVPNPQEEDFFYQTLVGAWPLEKGRKQEFASRLDAYFIKALREAKTNTSWIEINEAYEKSFLRFIHQCLKPSNARFLESFHGFAQRIQFYGMLNSLSATVLKMTCPGTPDFYQGCELWDLSLVDPDNRRPVDYEKRTKLLKRVQNLCVQSVQGEDLFKNWKDGRLKLFIIHRLLKARNSFPELWAFGEYLPIQAKGKKQNHLIAFLRRLESQWALVLVPRLWKSLTAPLQFPKGGKIWKDVQMDLPLDAPKRWISALSDKEITIDFIDQKIETKAFLDAFPIEVYLSA